MTFRLAGLALGLAVAASPAAAAEWIAIPEPSDPWLFGLGVAGVLVGRRAARKRPPKQN
ncbi:PEP-CTERM sorting domain-containing protein [Novosphingobium sp. Gsoil 351]|uniref:PEP-CTERM sorting domain-containing protein n=1 Tax=Novosphingobium sp. Gsoil 351 TaxID=2675225 RepID=UPI0012B4D169|nr:PEP-CTERM sorting domain-containing protein [Novosphingobium sp. Gsoil 351]QGN53748.1 PEP-CTERM sorting domain-containing protein [Novosphingobium sp. Gsoil 351]